MGQISNAEVASIISKLSPRLKGVYRELMRGRSEKEAAHALGISIHTVHEYVKQLYVRFNVQSRGELMAIAIAYLASLAIPNPVSAVLAGPSGGTLSVSSADADADGRDLNS